MGVVILNTSQLASKHFPLSLGLGGVYYAVPKLTFLSPDRDLQGIAQEN